jgi:exodeoxyribonuclease VII small subunit
MQEKKMPKDSKPNSSSEVDLDEAIEKFDRGSKIASEIENHLKNAENKIKTIKSKS